MFLVLGIAVRDAFCKMTIRYLLKISDLILISSCHNLLFVSACGKHKMLPSQKAKASCLLCVQATTTDQRQQPTDSVELIHGFY